jgi:hypothetical protein
MRLVLSCGLLCWAASLSCASSTPAPATPAAEAAPAPAPSTESAAASAGAASCANPQLDDLEDGDNRGAMVDARGGYWYTFKDSLGTTLSPEGDFKPADGGAKSSAHAAHISGKLAASGTVYVGMGFNLADPMAPYDLSKASGICFDAKGSGPARVKLPDIDTAPEGHVCKTCYNDFGADFELPADWKEQCFKFSELKQQPGWGEPHPALSTGKVFSVQWQVAKPGVDYDLWIDNVRLTCE